MNCENCLELLSEYIDHQLDEKKTARVKAHLTLCRECANVYEDFVSIIGLCDLEITEEIPPPNEHALWCRINNIIESEVKPEVNRQQQQKKQEVKQNWLSRIWHHTWSLSLTQLVSAVLGVALVSSLLTVIGVQSGGASSSSSADKPELTAASTQPTFFEKVLSKVGLAETPQQMRERRLRERRAAIDYWNQRAAARRAQWDRKLRDAFDRNLNEIDQVVAEYSRTVEENPQDELTDELLDAALDEKMQLLRQFSEL